MRRVSKKTRRQESAPQFPISPFATLLPRNLHPCLIFRPEHDNYMKHMEALYKLHRKECEYPRTIDWAPLDGVGFSGVVHDALIQVMRIGDNVYHVGDFEKLISIQEPIYRELTQEFHCTVEQLEIKTLDCDFLYFRLGGSPRSLTLRQLAVYLGIYIEEELAAPWFARYLMGGAGLDEAEINSATWAKFSDKTYLSGKNIAKAMRSPLYRVLHKLISHTITLRGTNTEKVTKADLWYLANLKDKTRMNLPFCVGKYLFLYAKGTKQESRLCGGQFITRIARGLGINLYPRDFPFTLVPNPGQSVGIDMFRTTGVVRMISGQYIPFQPEAESSAPSSEPRGRALGKRPAGQHSDSDRDDDEEDEGGDRVMHEASGPGHSSQGHSQGVSQDPPAYWEGFLTRFDNMHLDNQQTRHELQQTFQRYDQYWDEQRDFRDEVRYGIGALQYQNDYLIHN